MQRLTPIVGLVLLGLIILGAPAASGTEAPELPPSAAADRAQLQEALAAQRVDTAPPRPGLALYVRDLSLAFGRWLGGLVDRFAPGFSALTEPLTRWTLIVLGSALGLVLILALLRVLSRRWQNQRAVPTSAPPSQPLNTAPEPTSGNPAHHAEQLQQHLERGEVGPAVEALWWWLASHLMPREVQASWTGRELIANAGRWDLLPRVRQLDQLTYGASRPSPQAVRQLWHALQEDLG